MPGKTYVVACKLPSGLHLDAPAAGIQDGMAGERDLSKRVTLNGTSSHYVSGVLQPGVHGYGITENVDADFYDDWMKRHADFPPVKNGLIFAGANRADVEKEARNRAGVASGFEGADPDKPAPGVEQSDKKD